jgi:hypothetical protein
MKKILFLMIAALAFLFLSGSPSIYADDIISSSPKQAFELIKTADKGKLFISGQLRLVVVNGSFREMGWQYGNLCSNGIKAVYNVLIQDALIDSGMYDESYLLGLAESQLWYGYPLRIRELISGISSGSGMDLRKVALIANPFLSSILMQMGGEAGIGAINSCTSIAVWGKYTRDGKTLTLHNFDSPSIIRGLFNKFGIVILFKPTDGSNSLMGPGLPGTVSMIDLLNSKGVYTEVNNAAGSAGSVVNLNNPEITMQFTNLMFEVENNREYAKRMLAVKASYPLILMSAGAMKAQYLEMSFNDAKAVDGTDSVVASANQFQNRDWGFLTPGGKAAWHSDIRRHNFLKLADKNQGKIDEKVMMQIADAPLFNNDGTYSNGASVLELVGDTKEQVTVWQVITHPADNLMWIRIPGYASWVKLDMNVLLQ